MSTQGAMAYGGWIGDGVALGLRPVEQSALAAAVMAVARHPELGVRSLRAVADRVRAGLHPSLRRFAQAAMPAEKAEALPVQLRGESDGQVGEGGETGEMSLPMIGGDQVVSVAWFGAQPLVITRGGHAITWHWGATANSSADVTDSEGQRVGTAYIELAAAIEHAATIASVGELTIIVDSPGGAVQGLQSVVAACQRFTNGVAETDQRRRRLSTITVGLAASCGYWVAACASPGLAMALAGAEIGYLGVYVQRYDARKALEMEGYSVEYIASNPRKVEASPYVELSNEARARLQRDVDELNDLSLRQVSAWRGFPGGAEAMRGFMADRLCGKTGEESVRFGLVDAVTESFDHAISWPMRSTGDANGGGGVGEEPAVMEDSINRSGCCAQKEYRDSDRDDHTETRTMSTVSTGGNNSAVVTQETLSRMNGGSELIKNLRNEAVEAYKNAQSEADNRVASLAELKELGFDKSTIVDLMTDAVTLRDAKAKANKARDEAFASLKAENEKLQKQLNDRAAAVRDLKNMGISAGAEKPLPENAAGSGVGGAGGGGGGDDEKPKHPYICEIDRIQEQTKCSRAQATARAGREFPELYNDYSRGRGGKKS